MTIENEIRAEIYWALVTLKAGADLLATVGSWVTHWAIWKSYTCSRNGTGTTLQRISHVHPWKTMYTSAQLGTGYLGQAVGYLGGMRQPALLILEHLHFLANLSYEAYRGRIIQLILG
jgi:hypothetical protein